MNRNTSLLLLSLVLFNSCEKTADEILHKTLRKIGSVSRIEQVLETNLVDSAHAFFKTDTSVYYFNFSNPRRIAGAKYHAPGYYLVRERPAENITYDIARVDTSEDGIIYYYGQKETFYYPTFGSLDALRRALPTWLSDTSIRITRRVDTLIEGKQHFQVRLGMANKQLVIGGGIRSLALPEVYTYSRIDLVIHAGTWLPATVVHKYYANQQFRSSWEMKTLWYNRRPLSPDKLWDITYNPLDFISYSVEEIRASRGKQGNGS